MYHLDTLPMDEYKYLRLEIRYFNVKNKGVCKNFNKKQGRHYTAEPIIRSIRFLAAPKRQIKRILSPNQ